MNDLKTVSALVKQILEDDVDARNSDNVLYRNKLLAAALLLLWQNPLSCRKGELWAQN